MIHVTCENGNDGLGIRDPKMCVEAAFFDLAHCTCWEKMHDLAMETECWVKRLRNIPAFQTIFVWKHGLV